MKKKTIFIIVGILIVIAIAAYLYFKNNASSSTSNTNAKTTSGNNLSANTSNPLAPVVPFSAQSFLSGNWVFAYQMQGATGTEKATISNNVYSIDGVPTYNLQNVVYNQATNTLTLTKVRISDGTVFPTETLTVDTVNNQMKGSQGSAITVTYVKS